METIMAGLVLLSAFSLSGLIIIGIHAMWSWEAFTVKKKQRMMYMALFLVGIVIVSLAGIIWIMN